MLVGTLPILLRNILSLQKAVGPRMIVCVDPIERPDVQCALEATGRLPRSVEWLEARLDTPISQLFSQITSISGNDHVVLVAGDSTYYPALFRQARESSKDRNGLALTSSDRPIGIHALSADTALYTAEHCPVKIRTFDQFHAWLILNQPVECEPIDESWWQHVLTPEDRIAAEEKLDRWLVKPTDGVFARMNRRISVPISRQLIKLPITPNMVSLFTLGVGLASGLFFARGGYWSTLVGRPAISLGEHS